jgi:hypothetical protein
MSYALRPTSECRCNSGKLYRDCCSKLTKLPKNASPDLRRRYWGKLVDECAISILDFLDRNELLDELRDEAADLMLKEVSESIDLENFLALWDAFTLFHYPIDLPSEDELELSDDEDELLEAAPAAILFVLQDEKGSWSKGDRQVVLKELLESSFSWFRVVDVVPGEGLLLHDIILDRETFVADVAVSRSAEKGWILCAKVLQFDGVALLHGLGARPLPPLALGMLREMAGKIRDMAADEFEGKVGRLEIGLLSPAIVSTYVRCATDTRQVAAPEMCNTDGDPMEPSSIRYAVQGASVEVLVERIKQVLGEVEDGPGAEVEQRDESGAPIKVIVPYIRAPKGEAMMDTVLVARFMIEPHEVSIEVNSVNRSTEIKQIVETHFNDILSFVSESSESLDLFMSRQQAGQVAQELPGPEVQEALNQHMQKMQEKWLTQPIPALGGLTPREAAETADGRVLLEALLDDFAIRRQQREAGGSSFVGFDVEELRARLGFKDLD